MCMYKVILILYVNASMDNVESKTRKKYYMNIINCSSVGYKKDI